MKRIFQTDNEKSLFPILSTNEQEIQKFLEINFERNVLVQVSMGL